jgi:hypothetical protein
MIALVEQPVLLPAGMHGVWACLLAAAAAVAWVALHRWPRAERMPSRRIPRPALVALRVGVGFAALALAADAAQRAIVLATPWPLWTLALLGAASVEAVVALYSLERRAAGKRTGTALVALRAGLVLLVVGMLAQPVLSLTRRDEQRRTVAVLLDDSASMHLRDTALSGGETMRLAEALSELNIRRPYRLERAAERLEQVGRRLTDLAESVGPHVAAAGTGRTDALEARRASLQEQLDEARRAVAQRIDAIAEPIDGRLELDDELRTELANLKARLAVHVRDRLARAAEIAADPDAARRDDRMEELLHAVRSAASELSAAVPRVRALGDELDAAFYDSLSETARDQLAGSVQTQTRRQLANAALTVAGKDADGEREPCLLDRLSRDYRVRVYRFADEAEPTSVADVGGSDGPAASRPGDAGETNLAAALSRAAADVQADRLAGVVLLSDARHNAPADVEPIARRLGLGGAPVCSVLVGACRPPRDAAVVGVEAPETVHESDRVRVTAGLKLDGLAGRRVRVSLLCGDRLCDEEVVRPTTPACRMRVDLSDRPEETGAVPYRVLVQRFDGEAFLGNNEYAVTVSVTGERTKMLLLEGRPRWEFRYLKNLFADRDPSVRMQYVLLEPDRIAGVRKPPVVPASADRPADRVAATAPPESEEEWMKFDVVVLGDVAPSALSAADREALETFICDRGKTLVVVAGPRYMPHAWAETELAELLSVTVAAGDGPVQAPEESYHLVRTDAGRDHPILQQGEDAEDSASVWEELPELYWRHPVGAAKPGATVLAYARAPGAPPDDQEAEDDEHAAERRRRYRREHALIACHEAGLGKVLLLAFDRTWRLRYGVGDTHHHRFWGQVVQWATGEKLPAGADYARLGTDRSRYPARSPVRVRAQLLRPDGAPLVTDRVAVKVFRDEAMVLRAELHPLTGSPGTYAAEFEPPGGGAYRVVLDAPAVQPRLEAEGVEAVATEISVDPAAADETIELSPDPALARRLAEVSGGVAVPPERAERVLEVLGEPAGVRVQRRDVPLWNTWPLLALLLAAATAEWLLRKKVHLP